LKRRELATAGLSHLTEEALSGPNAAPYTCNPPWEYQLTRGKRGPGLTLDYAYGTLVLAEFLQSRGCCACC
jgi:hypothetical protein